MNTAKKTEIKLDLPLPPGPELVPLDVEKNWTVPEYELVDLWLTVRFDYHFDGRQVSLGLIEVAEINEDTGEIVGWSDADVHPDSEKINEECLSYALFLELYNAKDRYLEKRGY